MLKSLALHTLLGTWAITYWIGSLVIQSTPHSPLGHNLACCLIPLTWLVTQICVLLHGYHSKNLHVLWQGVLLSNEALHYAAFSAVSLFAFFIAYEAVLVPLQILIAYWGSGVKRLRASLLFFLYTYAGSAPMLISVLYLTSFAVPSGFTWASAFFSTCCSSAAGMGLWITFALSFGAKTPLFPFFVWLLFAHAEAPVEGSMLLAGVVLKLATFGVVSTLLGMLWASTMAAAPYALTAAAYTLLIASTSLVQQTDLKTYVALSSVGHIGQGTLGLMSLSEEGVGGSLYMGLSHGLVSPSLFFLVGGFIYGGFATRLIYAYRGLLVLVPALGSFLIAHLFANIAVPISPNWISELLILAGLAHGAIALCFLSAFSVLASAVYTLWLSSRTVLGCWSAYLRSTGDLGFIEYACLALLSGLTLTIGLFAHGLTQALIAQAWTYLSRYNPSPPGGLG